jgi:eukaryotic-like serine/threonine-protein kinase
MPVPQGTRLGRYEIRTLLGAGGMGEVYLAHDTTLRRAVAIKLLPGDLAANTERLRRIQQEAYAASSLNHPNILTVHEIGAQEGTHFVATEFIDGETLRQRMARGRLELREILDIGEQVASALGAAHAAGIVHRDIKPENIMIRKDGIVKVLDFGLAKVVDAQGKISDLETRTVASTDTAAGMVLGTVQYMSPEQARALATDARTDVWSLGVVLYELLTGRATFEGRTTSDVIAAILKTEPTPLTKCADDVPTELERIVTRALQKDCEERYQTVKDLGLDLKALKRRLDFDAERARADAASAVTPDRARVDAAQWRRATSRRVVFASLAAAIAIMALAVAANRGLLRSASGDSVDSIAVMPFTNESGDPDHEYLSDGISVSVINALSQLSGVKVIARTSSFKYKNKEIDPQEVARALGVEAIVTGRVAQRGDSLLIGVELVDGKDRTQMWGDQYNRKATDLLQMQADISADIADKLRRRLSTGERDRLTKRETTSLQAYDLLLRGRYYFDKGGTQNRKHAIELYQQAIGIDPGYALVYVALSNAYRTLVYSSVLAPQEFMPKSEAAARKALELDDSLADAHAALGNFNRASLDWAGAEREFQRAIVLNPNLAAAHDSYSAFLSFMGRHDQSIAESTRAKELDPLSASISTGVGSSFLFARRYDEAVQALKQAVDVDPVNSVTRLYLGYTYAAKGMHRAAIGEYQEALRLGDETPSTQIYLGAAYANAGERERAQVILKQLRTGTTYVSPAELAILYGALGQHEEAFSSLEKAVALRDVQLVFLGVDPAFDTLRGDPRFADLMRRAGLPPIASATSKPR